MIGANAGEKSGHQGTREGETIIPMFQKHLFLPHCLVVAESTFVEAANKWKHTNRQAVVVHAFNPSTWEAETGRLLSSRQAWSTAEHKT